MIGFLFGFNSAYLGSCSALFCNIFIDKIQDTGKNQLVQGVVGQRRMLNDITFSKRH